MTWALYWTIAGTIGTCVFLVAIVFALYRLSKFIWDYSQGAAMPDFEYSAFVLEAKMFRFNRENHPGGLIIDFFLHALAAIPLGALWCISVPVALVWIPATVSRKRNIRAKKVVNKLKGKEPGVDLSSWLDD